MHQRPFHACSDATARLPMWSDENEIFDPYQKKLNYPLKIEINGKTINQSKC